MKRRSAGVVGLIGALSIGLPVALASPSSSCGLGDWPGFGRTAGHSFATQTGCAAIGKSNVATLVPSWFFHAPDSITASPAVSRGVVYVGSWDGTFYAIDAATGALRWSFTIRYHAKIAFGRIVSSASVVDLPDAKTGKPREVVIFGGGSSIWALDAKTGAELATLDLDPRTAALRKKQDASSNPPTVEVESSPAVTMIDGKQRIFVGLDTHNDPHAGRAGLVSLGLASSKAGRWSFDPLWKYDVETTKTYVGTAGLTEGSGQGWGCGGVWSSPAVDPTGSTVAFGTASCDYPAEAYDAHQNYEENMVALDARTGKLRWRYRPADELPDRAARIADANRDADFGASANIFKIGSRWVVGEGRKSGEYYVRDMMTGRKVTTTVAGQEGHLQDGFGVGGFLGTTAIGADAKGRPQVMGATAIPVPHSVGDLDRTTWAVRALDPEKGTLTWTYRLAGPSYAHSSVSNGALLFPDTTNSSVMALDTDTGLPLWVAPVIGPPSSTAVVAGSQLFVATGTRETDLEFKAFNSNLQTLFGSTIGESPLSPLSGVQAFKLAGG